MLILGIETSCDETSAAILNATPKKLNLLSNIVASSIDLHAKTGGIIPETAARQQLLYIMPVIKRAFKNAGLDFHRFEVDKIAITYGPGLIGSLLVGVETARALSYVFNKEIIPVNHLFGHVYANWLDKDFQDIKFPAVALIVSGGHTDLVFMKSHKTVRWLGGTRDDAAGEAFDKIGRLLGLPYPGGPFIEESAKRGDSKSFIFPRPLIDSGDFDFSFSGLKTAVLREVNGIDKISAKKTADICASAQSAIVEVLVSKTLMAADKFGAKSILLGGGVAANQKLRNGMQNAIAGKGKHFKLYAPSRSLCTDNGAMIASAAYFNNGDVNWKKVDADPGLYFQNII